MSKALLIRSSTTTKSGKQGHWHVFDQAQPYIQGIETIIDADIDSEIVNTLVSGIPTPWARARLFEMAFKSVNLEANIKKTGLIEFYNILIQEWKGFLACLAIHPSRIRISPPIKMEYNLESDYFDIPSALGRMLFEDMDLWTDPDTLSRDPGAKPGIQLIYYNDQLIGAISPYSLLFTAAEYSGIQQKDMPWYRDGYFQDPMSFLSNDQKQKLYLLVYNIDRNFKTFEQKVNTHRKGKLPIDYNGFKDFIFKWAEEIKESGVSITKEGTLDAPLDFDGIYKPLFNVKQSVYFDNQCNAFYEDGEGRTEIDPKTILLQGDHIMEFPQNDEKQLLSRSAIHFLEVIDPNNTSQVLYFPIPLSEPGFLLFGNNRINDLLTDSSNLTHRLYGEFKDGNLKVTLELDISGKIQKYSKEYEVLINDSPRSIILWPDFVSSNWNTYYLYSEFPRNAKNVQFIPFFLESTGPKHWQPIKFDGKNELLYATNKLQTQVKVENLISYPDISLDSSHHPYDIIKSDKPFAGLKVVKTIDGKDSVLGFLLVKSPVLESTKLKELSLETQGKSVDVGFDFGSNNSCIQFAETNGGDPQSVPFKNRRIFLVGTEVIDASRSKIALPNELYFFQNGNPKYGQIKSWVHEHDPKYVVSGMEEEALAGGVAVFESNLHIKNMDEKTITTNAGTMHHSMKWLTEKKDNEKKIAYLKNVWIQVCADLYESGYLPKTMKWSYPGSFSPANKISHRLNYLTMISFSPIERHKVELDEDSLTESEAVSKYALTVAGLQPTNVFLGIDVGGSTSDILVIALDDQDNAYKLLKQSSVRLAAKYLMDAILKSTAFRQVLISFHDSTECNIKIPNIRTILELPDTAPFFLNAFFDRLKDSELRGFYSFMARKDSNLFAIPAYITGLLLFYSGKLISKLIKDNDFLSRVKQVDLFPFGKGGRIFDWLGVLTGGPVADKYYNACFLAGFDDQPEKMDLKKNDEIRKDNKSEVAKGLVAHKSVNSASNLSEQSDIFGESNFVFIKNEERINIGKDQNITTEHFKNLDFSIEFPEKFEEFGRFLDLFLDFAKTNGIINNSALLKQKEASMYGALKRFITNDREFQNAQKNKGSADFEFKHSMLILEGMCFLEEFLIPEIYKE